MFTEREKTILKNFRSELTSFKYRLPLPIAVLGDLPEATTEVAFHLASLLGLLNIPLKFGDILLLDILHNTSNGARDVSAKAKNVPLHSGYTLSKLIHKYSEYTIEEPQRKNIKQLIYDKNDVELDEFIWNDTISNFNYILNPNGYKIKTQNDLNGLKQLLEKIILFQSEFPIFILPNYLFFNERRVQESFDEKLNPNNYLKWLNDNFSTVLFVYTDTQTIYPDTLEDINMQLNMERYAKEIKEKLILINYSNPRKTRKFIMPELLKFSNQEPIHLSNSMAIDSQSKILELKDGELLYPIIMDEMIELDLMYIQQLIRIIDRALQLSQKYYYQISVDTEDN